MIKVKYRRYYNDYREFDEVKSFSSLEDLADWLFGMVKGEYKEYMYFVNPNDDNLRNGKLYLDSSCIKSNDGKYIYWIDQIEKDGFIIYSDGRFTNGICHWNDEVKQWLLDCRNRRNNPIFNFG